jgi:sigma-B regulation protein RsbU (phosphoserine phosphatase)
VNACGKSQPALGLFEDAIYETSSAKLAPGDLVILFTDGLYEVHNPANEIYTPALLLEGVQKRAQRGAGKLFDELLEEIRAFSGGTGFSDDVCLVGVELAG